MGAPSPCSVSEPETLLAPPSGGLISAMPLASQPPPDGAISNSSWPTVCPPSLTVNLPLSWAKTTGPGDSAAFFWAARDNAAHATIPRVSASDAVLKFTVLVTPASILSQGRGFSTTRCAAFPPDATCRLPRGQLRRTNPGCRGAVHAVVGKLIGRQTLS